MLFFCLILSFTVASLAISGGLDSAAASKVWRSKARDEFASKVDKAFRSDRFIAVGGLRGTDLAAASYSPTGSVYQSLYIMPDGSADNTCSDVSTVIGFAVNQCVVLSSYAFKVQLVSDSCSGAVIQYFGDMQCKSFLGTSYLEDTPLGCAPTQDPKADPNEYQQIKCTTSAAPAFPTTNVLAGEFYEDKTCSGSTVEYEAFVIDKCFHFESFYFAYKCDNDVPLFNMYSAANCAGEPQQSFSFPSQCYPEEDDTVYDDTYMDTYLPPIINPPPSVSTTPFPTSHGHARSTAVFCTYNEPTLMPAGVPTMFPTKAVKQAAVFDVSQVLYGISAAVFNANSANAQVLKTSIAAAMTSVSSGSVKNLQVADITTSAARAHKVRSAVVHSPQAVDPSAAVTVTYTVSTQSTHSAAQLVTQLAASVTSGAFNTNLQSNAQSSGTAELLGCTSDAVSTTVVTDTDNDDERPLDGGGVFGVVVGVMFIAAIFIGAVYAVVVK
mmetsp:Transcript_25636/g.44095  ORF Transcript_25636/g.44095 Transcript_25636/m.44095 type:complete len:496 (-) Transcript_25636:190-1677(-)